MYLYELHDASIHYWPGAKQESSYQTLSLLREGVESGHLTISSEIKLFVSICLLISFQKSFSDSLANPEFVMSDFAKFDRPGQLHIAFQALDKFQSTVGRLPRPYNKEDALKFVEIAKETNTGSPCKVDSCSHVRLAL